MEGAINTLVEARHRRNAHRQLNDFVAAWAEMRSVLLTYGLDCFSQSIPQFEVTGPHAVKLYHVLSKEDAHEVRAFAFLERLLRVVSHHWSVLV